MFVTAKQVISRLLDGLGYIKAPKRAIDSTDLSASEFHRRYTIAPRTGEGTVRRPLKVAQDVIVSIHFSDAKLVKEGSQEPRDTVNDTGLVLISKLCRAMNQTPASEERVLWTGASSTVRPERRGDYDYWILEIVLPVTHDMSNHT